MRDGRIEQLGKPQQLYDGPQSLYVANFLGKSNLFKGAVVDRSAREFSVSWKGQKLSVKSSNTKKIGDLVVLAVRPERIAFLHSDESADNVISGVVSKETYLGAIHQFTVTSKNEEILVTCAHDQSDRRPTLGENVRLCWRATDFAGVY